jgi:hypothetical protein
MPKTIEAAIAKARETDPRLAEFVEISYQDELDAGVRASVATSKWIKVLTKATR